MRRKSSKHVGNMVESFIWWVLDSEMKERSARNRLIYQATNGPDIRVNVHVPPKQHFWSGVTLGVMEFLMNDNILVQYFRVSFEIR